MGTRTRCKMRFVVIILLRQLELIFFYIMNVNRKKKNERNSWVPGGEAQGLVFLT